MTAMSHSTDNPDEPLTSTLPPPSGFPSVSPPADSSARSRTPERTQPAGATQASGSTPVAHKVSTHGYDFKHKEYNTVLAEQMSPFYHEVDCSEFMNHYVTVASLGPDATGDVGHDEGAASAQPVDVGNAGAHTDEADDAVHGLEEENAGRGEPHLGEESGRVVVDDGAPGHLGRELENKPGEER